MASRGVVPDHLNQEEDLGGSLYEGLIDEVHQFSMHSMRD